MRDKAKKLSLCSLLFLHIILLIYAGSSICSKFAAAQKFMSLPFVLFYAGVILLLLVYAVLWQQILKKMSLTVAFANKSVVMIWGMLAGAFIWNEKISWIMVLGAAIIVFGVCLVVSEDK